MMGWQLHQLEHMQIICTSLQTDNHDSTSPQISHLQTVILSNINRFSKLQQYEQPPQPLYGPFWGPPG